MISSLLNVPKTPLALLLYSFGQIFQLELLSRQYLIYTVLWPEYFLLSTFVKSVAKCEPLSFDQYDEHGLELEDPDEGSYL